MAEPVGFAASLVTLLQVVAVSYELGHRIQNAPAELARVTSQLTLLHTELHLLSQLENSASSSTWQLPEEILTSLSNSLSSAQQAILAIRTACNQQTRGNPFGFRFYWAFLGRETVSALLDNLRRTECSLTVVLNLLVLHRSDQVKESLTDIGAGIQQVRQEMVSMKKTLESYEARPQTILRTLGGSRLIDYFDSAQGSKQVVRNTKTRHVSASYLYGLFWYHGTMSSMWNDEQATYFVSLRSRLPLRKLFVADVALRIHPLTWPSFSILRGGGLAIKHVVADDAAIMKACSRGDTFQIRELFSNKEASPNDVTASNSTPMHLAIESGNEEAVELLIRQGADVNWTFGCNQTSPLAWALGQRKIKIARLLVSHGASFDHVSAFGWSPLFYLWVDTEVLQPSAMEYLTILSAKPDFSTLHAGLLDINGWGVIHRVVAFGTTDEVATLLRLGANPFEVVTPLRWTAIHHAVYYGRYDTFLELLPYYEHIDVDDPDERGWSLLHIAASAGHEVICKHLISIGADWQKRSWKFYSHMPDCLYGGNWTPAEVAGAQSEERSQRFMHVVSSSGKIHETQNMLLDNPDLPDLWYDATEVVAT